MSILPVSPLSAFGPKKIQNIQKMTMYYITKSYEMTNDRTQSEHTSKI
jgi:hypothetical protein